ncbi:hypothetical protein TNIN_20971 [Trichonephila inaurata madagascariensis]|uniref:Uncharacterized protein n=1 Tax=Trichonephila inaurata madagascariensis TaxID=2747483 RepID=A0A8X6XYH5_9ARAC|nr:hypothetical protein TNIN_20971 [Trichonephila inaurata madagascariensis]
MNGSADWKPFPKWRTWLFLSRETPYTDINKSSVQEILGCPKDQDNRFDTHDPVSGSYNFYFVTDILCIKTKHDDFSIPPNRCRNVRIFRSNQPPQNRRFFS